MPTCCSAALMHVPSAASTAHLILTMCAGSCANGSACRWASTKRRPPPRSSRWWTIRWRARRGLVSVDKGHDPRDFALFAFGGAGPMHATAIARELGVPHVLVPRFPGITSALGCVLADVRHDFVRTLHQPLEDVDAGAADSILADQAAEGRALLAEEGSPRVVCGGGRARGGTSSTAARATSFACLSGTGALGRRPSAMPSRRSTASASTSCCRRCSPSWSTCGPPCAASARRSISRWRRRTAGRRLKRL